MTVKNMRRFENGNQVEYARERRMAERAVHRASILTKRAVTLTPSYWASSPVSPCPSRKLSNGEISKSDASPVTAADFAAQALLISAIHGAFPADSFVGEEDADSLRQDPLLAIQVFDFVRQYANVKFYPADGQAVYPDDEEELYTPSSIEEMLHIIDLGGRGKGGRTGRFWALDPIDGTATFVKGQQYAVSLALIEEGKEVVGVLGCPNLKLPEDGSLVTETSVDHDSVGLLLSAVKGQGAWVRPMGWEGSKLRVAQPIDSLHRHGRTPPKTARNGHMAAGTDAPLKLSDLHFIDSSISTATLSDKVHKIAAACGVSSPFTELYSSHVRYIALILGGREAVQVRFPRHSSQLKKASMCIWDHAGAQLIYAESRNGNGKVTDLYGKEIDFGTGRKMSGNWGILTCDESVHAQLLELVGHMLEEEGSR
ncbi:hypothetical protein QBC37DRAFT_36952 [Rhypophila decipiens]|uniref:3'(2'),5'-bisphosphate nucleotidase n=1 Tax=Rhypophila decipiens TaxID=261697 RepID=A0AAN7B2F3_9PEZI|nr:hypothetical protein QBC37DRAFT_36952 [Rhypophila decipiens]